MTKKLIGAGVILILVIIGVIYMGAPGSIDQALSNVFADDEFEKPGDGDRSRPVPVDIAPVERGTALSVFRTTGEIIADERVTLTSEIRGRISKIFIEDGMSVAEGDPIVRFDDDSEKAAVAAAEARLSEAVRARKRVEQLAEKDFATTASLDEAVAAVQSAEADLALAKTRLADRTVRTPFSGKVGLVMVSPGALLEPGSGIAELVSVDDLRAQFAIPERYASQLDTGTLVRVTGTGGEPIESSIAVLSPIVRQATRSIEAEAPIQKSDQLRPGSFVRIEVVLDRRDDALFVPQTAILRQGSSASLFRVSDGTAERLNVETGVRKDGLIEVRAEGLDAGDQVVAQGLQKIGDGAQVTSREQPARAQSAKRASNS